MGKGGQTVSATDFATLTGVSRERLRTWERRHGFPAPVRHGGGARRYDVEDVGRVVAVRRAVESGVPLQTAIAATELPATPGITDQARAALAEHAPIAVVALSGPEPLRVEFVNAAVRSRPGAPQPGELLLDRAPWYAEDPGIDTLRRLFTADVLAAACEHPDWTAGCRPGAHSIAYRLPHASGERPLVALIGIDTARERRTREALTEVEQERDLLRQALERDGRFAEAAAAVVDVLRARGGAAALADACKVLLRRVGAVDTGLAPYMAGALVLGRSTRGLLGPEMVTVSRFDDLGEALQDGEPTFLSPPSARAFGAPDGVAVVLAPMLAAGEVLGGVLVVFEDGDRLTDAQRRLLRVIAGTMAFALLRERLQGDLRDSVATR